MLSHSRITTSTYSNHIFRLALTQEPARFFAYAHSIGDTTWRDLAELETHNIPTKEVFEALKQYPDWPPIFGAWVRAVARVFGWDFDDLSI